MMEPMSSNSNYTSSFHNNGMEGEVVCSILTKWKCNLSYKKKMFLMDLMILVHPTIRISS